VDVRGDEWWGVFVEGYLFEFDIWGKSVGVASIIEAALLFALLDNEHRVDEFCEDSGTAQKVPSLRWSWRSLLKKSSVAASMGGFEI
jgi:hypothetical protein